MVGPAGRRELLERAAQLYAQADRRLPSSLETLIEGVHSLDVKLSYDLRNVLERDEVGGRADYQRLLANAGRPGEATAEAEKSKHAAAGTRVGQAGLYFRSDLEAKLEKAPPRGPGFTPFGMSRKEKEIHEAKLNALADVARRAAAEKMTPEQQDAAFNEIQRKAEDVRLASQDVDAARAERERKINELPWILRVLVQQIQGWSDFGRGMSSGDEKAARPSLLGRLVGQAFAPPTPKKTGDPTQLS